MLYDHRTYTVRRGTLAKQLTMYAEHGYAIQVRHLGAPVFYAVTETGPLNSYVHIWAYADEADRQAKRAALAADPEWQAYFRMSNEAGYIVEQTTKLMVDAPFFTR